MPDVDVPIGGGFHESKSLSLVAEKAVNFFPVIPQSPGASGQTAIFNTQGIVEFADTSGGAGRGWIIHKDELYSIHGTTLYKISSSAVVTNLGTVAGTSRCSLAENGESIAIVVPDGNSYFYDTTAGLVQITDVVFVGFGQVTSVIEKDFYFIFTTDTLFFNSSLASVNKGQDFNALDFGSAEVSTDKILRAFTVRDELVIIGTSTIEIFQNVGGADFPFQRIEGAHVSKGMCARFGIVEYDNGYVYLGNSKDELPSIWRGTSSSAVKISTDAIDNKIQSFTKAEIEDVFTWTYSMDGYFYAGWTVPTTTFIYDGTASANSGRPIWHERQTSSSRWRVNDVINVYGKVLVQDNTTGKIGQISSTTYTEYGSSITRDLISQYIEHSGKPVFNYKLELHIEQATTTDNLASPTVELLISDDGGRSFVSMGTQSLGKVGETARRVVWRRLGHFRQTRIYKLTTAAPVKLSFYKMTIGVEPAA